MIAFEDYIDGYFPFDLALWHLLDRHGFAFALVVLRVAPMMEIPGLAARAPVPLHVNPDHAGQIDWLAATVRKTGDTATVSGDAVWSWNASGREGEETLPASIRLAEPAFLRGVGFQTGGPDLWHQAAAGVSPDVGDRKTPMSKPSLGAQPCEPDVLDWPLSNTGQVTRMAAQPIIPERAVKTGTDASIRVCKDRDPITQRLFFDLVAPDLNMNLRN